jgi:hypothetical protein
MIDDIFLEAFLDKTLELGILASVDRLCSAYDLPFVAGSET